MKKHIKIQVWTDLFYARFVAFWRPEEEEEYQPPKNDTRSRQEINIPYLLVLSTIFKGRDEVVGANPVATSQHPMPPDFLKTQVRHICYLFANEYGIFKPPSNAITESFLAKLRVGYILAKEINVVISDTQGSITLKDLRDSLLSYTDEQLESVQVMVNGEHPDDVISRQLLPYVYKPPATDISQYISINRITPVYEIADPYIRVGQVTSETIENMIVPGTEDTAITKEQIALAQQAILKDEEELNKLKAIDNAPKVPPVDTGIPLPPGDNTVIDCPSIDYDAWYNSFIGGLKT